MFAFLEIKGEVLRVNTMTGEAWTLDCGEWHKVKEQETKRS